MNDDRTKRPDTVDPHEVEDTGRRGYEHPPTGWIMVPRGAMSQAAYRGSEQSRKKHATADWSKWLALVATVIGGIVAAVWVLASILGSHATNADVKENAAVIQADVRANDKRIDGHEVRLQVMEQHWRTISSTLKEIRDDVKVLKEQKQ